MILLEGEADSCILKKSKDLIQVLQVVLNQATVNNDIINIDKCKFPKEAAQECFHLILEKSWGVGKAHCGNHQLFMAAVRGDKGSFPSVLETNFLLKKSLGDIQWREDDRSAQWTKYIILMWQRVNIWNKALVHMAEVHHHPGFAIVPDNKGWTCHWGWLIPWDFNNPSWVLQWI